MRRVLAALSKQHEHWRYHDFGQSDVVEKVREMVQGKNAVALADGPEDLKKFGEE